MDFTFILVSTALIILFGFFSEFIFQKTGIPDVLLLLSLGFIIGPNMLQIIDPSSIIPFAPLFTTFALLFLMFDGSLSIDLRSFAKGFFSSTYISIFNFLVSTAVISIILIILGFDILISILVGFTLGGISSAFVIPILKQLKIDNETYTILTLESAITDVFTIIGALTIMQLIKINSFNLQTTLNQLISLFAIAGLVGIISAAIWIILDKKVFNKKKSFMSTIAFLILIYFITEYLKGNGAIAAMFFGLFIKNSKQITSIFHGIKSEDEKLKSVAMSGELGIDVITKEEELFYNQISFFLKTFFFVYIGILLNINNTYAMIIGFGLAVAILIFRNSSMILTKNYSSKSKALINSIFARGLAAAAVIQIAVSQEIITDLLIIDMVYFFIVSTIILSSIRIFIYKYKYEKKELNQNIEIINS